MAVKTLLGHPVAPRGSGDGGYVLLPMEWQLSPGQARKQTVAATRVAGGDLRSKRSSGYIGLHRYATDMLWKLRCERLYSK